VFHWVFGLHRITAGTEANVIEPILVAIGGVRAIDAQVASANLSGAHPAVGVAARKDAVGAEARGNIRGNIRIVLCVRIVRVPGRYGRSGAIRTNMTPELPG
jgi:hypothetical protein